MIELANPVQFDRYDPIFKIMVGWIFFSFNDNPSHRGLDVTWLVNLARALSKSPFPLLLPSYGVGADDDHRGDATSATRGGSGGCLGDTPMFDFD